MAKIQSIKKAEPKAKTPKAEKTVSLDAIAKRQAKHAAIVLAKSEAQRTGQSVVAWYMKAAPERWFTGTAEEFGNSISSAEILSKKVGFLLVKAPGQKKASGRARRLELGDMCFKLAQLAKIDADLSWETELFAGESFLQTIRRLVPNA